MKSKFPIVAVVIAACVSPVLAQEASVSMQIDLVAWGDTVSGLSLKPGQTNATIMAQGFTYSLKPE